MPLFLLQMKCDFEHINSLVPSLGDKWQITLIVGCLNDEETTKEIHLDLSNDKVELEGGGLADSSFSFSKQQKATITYVKRGNGSYNEDNVGKFVTLLGLECRGCVPKEWKYTGAEFNAIAESGKVFEMIDLTDKDGWYDYDETNDTSVSVQGFEYKFELSR